MSGRVDARLAELSIDLPTAAAPAANYVPWVIQEGMLYISGQVPMRDGDLFYQGKCGRDLDLATAREAARLCGLNVIAQAKAALGDLDKVARVVKLTGFVNGTAEFDQQPQVINGASDLMVEVFGDSGRHARSAVGVASLPFGVAVEVEAILAVV